jgi:hypothetical protein
MNMRDLALLARTTGRPYHCHVPDCRHFEPETLATPQSGSLYDLDFGQLVVPVADAIDGLSAEKDAAPEFTDFEFCGFRNTAKYMSTAARRPQTRAVRR